MQNKTKDWLSEALDTLPPEVPPLAFPTELDARLRREGLRPDASNAPSPAGRLLSFVRPVVTAAAAALLLAIGYQLGAESSNHAETVIDSDGAIAEADLIDLYEMREVIEAWDLASDADLESGFQALAAEDEAWVDEFLADGE